MLSSGDLEDSGVPPVQTPFWSSAPFLGTPHSYGSSLLAAWQNAGDAQLSMAEHLSEHFKQSFRQFRAVRPLHFHLLPPGESLGGKMWWKSGGA